MTRTVSHRELQNNSSQILRLVEAGETIEISNHGVVVALMMPPQPGPYRSLRVRPARVRGGLSDLRAARLDLDEPIQDSIDELRGD